MRRARIVAVLAGLAVYFAAFYATRLPALPGANDSVRRIDLLGQVVLLPDQYLLSSWFGSPPQFTIIDRLPVLLIAGAILAWAGVLGWLLLTACGLARRASDDSAESGSRPSLALRASEAAPDRFTRLETFVFSMGVGLATLSTWVLLVGLLGLMSRTWLFVTPATLTFLAAGWVRFARRNSREPTAPGKSLQSKSVRRGATAGRGFVGDNRSDGLLSARWLWLAVPFVVAILLAAMLPPFDFDVCEYHMQAPKEFFQQGRITFLPHNVYANMPMGTEMLSLLAMVVAGDWWLGALAGKTVLAAFTPLCAAGLYAAGRRLFSPTAGVAAALVYLSIPWVASTSMPPWDVNVSSSGLVEGALACYLFLAVYAMLLHRAALARSATERVAPAIFTPPRRLLLLAGYLAGATVAAKYPAALFVLLPLAAWVFFGRSRASNRTGAIENSRELTAPSPFCLRRGFLGGGKRLGVFLLAAVLACGLWFGKNWALTGNPTYPLLYGAFGGKTWNAEKDARWNRVHRPHDFSAAALGGDVARVAVTSPWLSPLVVPLAVLAIFAAARRSRWKGDSPIFAETKIGTVPGRLVWPLLGYVVFVLAVWWLLTHRIDRFWLPILPVLALLAGAGACWTRERWWRWTFRGLLLVCLAANFLVATAGLGNAWFVPIERLRNDPKWVDPWHRYFNAHADRGTVLTVGDAAVFDLRPRAFYSTCFDDCLFEQLVKGKTPDQIRDAFAARRIAYVYVNWGEIERYRSPGNYGFTDFVQPAVLARLVADGILAPLPAADDRPPGRAYRVLVNSARSGQPEWGAMSHACRGQVAQ
ncbi:MAG: hypothetical protein ABFC96_17755 [Thermoguttaceae bacterium]